MYIRTTFNGGMAEREGTTVQKAGKRSSGLLTIQAPAPVTGESHRNIESDLEGGSTEGT